MHPTPTLPLDYRPPPPARPAALLTRRATTLLLIAASLTFAIAKTAGPLRRYVDALARERTALAACLTHTPPIKHVVFDESIPRRSAALDFDPPGDSANPPRVVYRSSRHGPWTTKPKAGHHWHLTNMPPCWDNLLDACAAQSVNGVRCRHGLDVGTPKVRSADGHTWDNRCHALLFMHERRAQDGRKRLVIVRFDGPAFVLDQSRPFSASVHRVSWDGRIGHHTGASIACVGFAPPAHLPIRLHAGHPDPADPSRFTIPLKIGESDWTIKGRLHNDDTITLTAAQATLLSAAPPPPQPGLR